MEGIFDIYCESKALADFLNLQGRWNPDLDSLETQRGHNHLTCTCKFCNLPVQSKKTQDFVSQNLQHFLTIEFRVRMLSVV